MLDPRIHTLGRLLLPETIVSRLDPFLAEIDRFASAAASSCPAGALVLDAGAGEAQYRNIFSHCRYIAVDLAVGDPGWDYSKLSAITDLCYLPFADSTFDIALCLVVLEHLPEPALAVKEIARVLKPGGRLFVIAPLLWEEHQTPHDYFRFTRYGLSHLLRQAGLKVETLSPIGGYFWVLGRRFVNLLGFFQGGARWILFVLLLPLFGVLLPLACYYLDRFDKKQEFTLGYRVIATKPT